MNSIFHTPEECEDGLRSFDHTLHGRIDVAMEVDTALRSSGGLTMRVTRRRREGRAGA